MIRIVSDDGSGARAGLGKGAILAAIVAMALLFAYSNSLHGPFIFDDAHSIPMNPTIRRLWPLDQVLSPPNDGQTVTGRPVLNLSFALNWAAGGDSVFGYHLTNLVIHVLAALTLFGIIRRTLLLPSMKRGFADSADLLAAVASGIWAIHPLQTESVTYIVQRAESLAGLFYLLTLYCFVRGVRSKYRQVWFIASFVACLVGMGTKEIMVSAPLIVLLYDRAFVARSIRGALLKRWRYHVALACTWILLAYVVVKAGDRGGTAVAGFKITSIGYLRIQMYAIARYLFLSFWPRGLILDYGTTIIKSFNDVWPQTVMLTGILVLTLVALRFWPRLGFLGAWFFATIAPSSSFIPLTQTVAEHRMYLPLAAVIVFVVIGVYQALWRIESETAITGACILVIGVLGVLGGATFERNAQYGSDVEIWQDAVTKKPDNPRAQRGAGWALVLKGRPAEGMPYLDRAVLLDSQNANAYNDRGVAHFRLGDFSLAINDYSASLQIRSDDGGVYINRALARYAIKDYTQTRDDIAKASELGIEADPASFPDLFLKRDASKTPGRGGP